MLPAGWLTLNDPLTRALLFVPLFTLLIVRLHRNTLAGSPGLTGVLNQPLFTYLVRIHPHACLLHPSKLRRRASAAAAGGSPHCLLVL